MAPRLILPRSASDPTFAAKVAEHARYTQDDIDELRSQLKVLTAKMATMAAPQAAPAAPAASPVIAPISTALTPQLAGVPSGLTLPAVSQSQDGQLFEVMTGAGAPSALWRFNGSTQQWQQVSGGGGGGGGVTSVDVGVPTDILSSTGGPITTSGVITLGKVNQQIHQFWAGPPSGASGSPVFRNIVKTDVPFGISRYDNNWQDFGFVNVFTADPSSLNEQPLGSFSYNPTLPFPTPNLNFVGAHVRYVAYGTLNISSLPVGYSITFNLRVQTISGVGVPGSQILAQWTPGLTAAGSYNWRIVADVLVAAAGVSGTLEGHGEMAMYFGGGIDGVQVLDQTSAPVGNFNVGGPLVFQLTCQPSGSTPGSIVQRQSIGAILN